MILVVLEASDSIQPADLDKEEPFGLNLYLNYRSSAWVRTVVALPEMDSAQPMR